MNSDTDKGVLYIIARMEGDDTDCWNWTRSLGSHGYGQAYFKGKPYLAHRLSYLIFKGPLDDKHVDHLCYNKKCVNPDHLEAVTQAENNKRAGLKNNRTAAITPCPNGHGLEPRYRDSRNKPVCKECRNIAQRKYRSNYKSEDN